VLCKHSLHRHRYEMGEVFFGDWHRIVVDGRLVGWLDRQSVDWFSFHAMNANDGIDDISTWTES
jgi:hypothetical protein